MGAKTYVVDSGATARRVKTFYAVDSGGTVRKIKKGWVIDSGGTPRLFFGGVDDFSLFVGTTGVPGEFTIGYAADGPLGSITPSNVLGDAKTIQNLLWSQNTQVVQLAIAGFAADPGIGYLTSLGINDNARILSGASAGYSYGFGTAQWQWGGQVAVFAPGGTYNCETIRG